MTSRRLRTLMRDGWIQDQHGAWPMAILPLIVGAALSGPAPLQLLLALTWLAGFHAFNAATLWATTAPGRRSRHVRPLAVWSVVTVVLGVPLLVLAPHLLGWAFLYLPLILVASVEILRGRGRSLASRTSTILAASLMAGVTASVGARATTGPVAALPTLTLDVWAATVTLALLFLGTVPHVRSMVRGWGDRRWVVAAAVWHLAAGVVIGVLALAGLVPWLTVAVWVPFAARTVALPVWQARRGGRIRPMVLGAAETLWCVAVALSLLV